MIDKSGLSANLCPEELRVIELLRSHTYDEVSAVTGWSRGRIYALALKTGARKTEDRIRERHEARKQRQKETLQELLNTTARADVLDFLDGVPDNAVAMHFTSPPYNLGKKYGECASADTMLFSYYHGWLMQVISEMARTVRPGGVVCLNVGKTRDWENRLMPLDVLLFEDLRRSGLTFQSRIVWTISHGLTPKARLADRHETILVFSKGDQATFNPNAVRVPQKQPGKRAFKGPNKGGLSGHPLGAHPTDVWADIGQVGHNHPDAREGRHPAQFPVGLVKRAVLLYTMAGDLVCDAFSGSGSTAVACVEAGRNFVGADLFYEDLRTRRLAVANLDAVSPLPGVTDESLAVWQAEARRVDRKPVAVPAPAADREMCLELGVCA
jgi:DNA modification methylase